MEGPNIINSIFVTYYLSDSHRLKKNKTLTKEGQISTSAETVITIEGLEPEESYNVTVAFVTNYGKSEPSEVVQSLGTLDSMRKTDGCIIDNDEKYKTKRSQANADTDSTDSASTPTTTSTNEPTTSTNPPTAHTNPTTTNIVTAITMIDCAKKCAMNNDIGWSFEVSTKRCLLHRENKEETMDVTYKSNGTDETKTVKLPETEFKIGWVTGTPACSEASDEMESCPSDVIGSILVTGGLGKREGFYFTI